jgi:threonine/homoserine/homoserine lactone efflux protein
MEFSYLIEGFLFGLFLSVSMGPIFVALTITSIEKGMRPGMTVGLGVWVSDFAYIGLLYYFIHAIKHTIQSSSFNLILGTVGGVILILYGLKLFLHKGKLDYSTGGFSAKNYFGFWLKGFLVNTLNPFTPIFWIGVISTYILGRNTNTENTLLFLGSIMFVIIASDSIKVILASIIRQRLNNHHFRVITSVSGIIMVGLGMYVAGKELLKTF